MSVSSLAALKAASESKSLDEKLSAERRRDCLVLILHHLQKCGYSQTAAQLRIEAENALCQYDHADNIDLLRILADYEEYYSLKYGEKPRYSRKHSADQRGTVGGRAVRNTQDSLASTDSTTLTTSNYRKIPKIGKMRLMAKRPSKVEARTAQDVSFSIENPENSKNSNSLQDFNRSSNIWEPTKIPSISNDTSLQVEGCTIPAADREADNPAETYRTKIKSIPSFGGDVELRALAITIQREILDQSPGVNWDDIVQLDDAKKTLTEAIILPLKYPHLFRGLLEPWRGVLLYGPPGNGT